MQMRPVIAPVSFVLFGFQYFLLFLISTKKLKIL